MENQVLNEIKEFAKKKLMETYGYCGVADGPDKSFLNSDDKKGNDIKIIIELVKE